MKKDKIFEVLKMKPPRKGGEKARLFPVLSETSKEGRAASIFLACLSLVPEFANKLLTPFGRPIGARSRVYCVTEIEFDDDKHNRPDGLIGVTTGASVWRALVEFKVGGKLESEQVERYLKVARKAELDAVITISNEIVPDPTFSPVKVNRQLLRSVSLFHVSWMQIFTHAQVLLSTGSIKDRDHCELLEEFIRFLSHKSTGIKGFTQMPVSWGKCIDTVRSDRKLNKNGEDEHSVVGGWVQEERELSFILSQLTHGYADVKRSRDEKKDGVHVFSKHLKSLVDRNILETELVVSDAAAPICVKLNLLSRSVHISMQLKPPKDKARSTACINWFTKQIPIAVEDCTVTAYWPGRTQPTSLELPEVRSDAGAITQASSSVLPTIIEAARIFELGAKFASRKGIIETIEREVERFYAEIGCEFTAWVPSPRSAKVASVAEEIVESTSYDE